MKCWHQCFFHPKPPACCSRVMSEDGWLSRLPRRWHLGVIVGGTGTGKTRALHELRVAGFISNILSASASASDWPAELAVVSVIAASELVAREARKERPIIDPAPVTPERIVTLSPPYLPSRPTTSSAQSRQQRRGPPTPSCASPRAVSTRSARGACHTGRSRMGSRRVQMSPAWCPRTSRLTTSARRWKY